MGNWSNFIFFLVDLQNICKNLALSAVAMNLSITKESLESLSLCHCDFFNSNMFWMSCIRNARGSEGTKPGFGSERIETFRLFRK